MAITAELIHSTATDDTPARPVRLRLVADAESREEMESLEYPERQTYIAEALHEQWDFVLPENIGALTDAPILCRSDDHQYDDDGSHFVHSDAIIAWFPDYAVRDEWEELASQGTVDFFVVPPRRSPVLKTAH